MKSSLARLPSRVPALAVSYLLGSLTTLAVVPVAGGFSGPFVITDINNPAGPYNFFSPPVGGVLGNWSATLTMGGSIDTSLAPNSISLAANPEFPVFGPNSRGGVAQSAGFVSGFTSEAAISIVSPVAGTFTFNFDLQGTTSVLETYTTDVGLETWSTDGSFTANLSPGELFKIRLFGELIPTFGLAGRGGAQLAAPGAQGVTVSNVNFQPVPETSTLIGGLAAAGLIGARLLQRRRQV